MGRYVQGEEEANCRTFAAGLTTPLSIPQGMSGPIFGLCPGSRDWIKEKDNPLTGKDWIKVSGVGIWTQLVHVRS
jgi:hypothetical protein